MYNRQLLDYLPPVLQNINEYRAIMNDAEQTEINDLWDALNSTLQNQFISEATENGISRWERILGIVPQTNLTFAERRFTILTRINEQIPFTIRTMEESLKTLCGEDGYAIEFVPNSYTLTVKVALGIRQNFSDVEKLLNRIVPANLLLTVTLAYNTNDSVHRFTHAELEQFTHYQIKNEVTVNAE